MKVEKYNEKSSIQSDEAVNNVEVKDMSPTIVEGISNDDMLKMFEAYEKDSQMNLVHTVCTALNKQMILGKEIIDKTTGMPRVNLEGVIMRYSDRYQVDFRHSRDVVERYPLTKEEYEMIDEGSKYRCIGELSSVNDFGNKRDIPKYLTIVPYVPNIN